MSMISVIIPCFNSEEYVARAIDSVLKQTYKQYEIILVNNNSSDNTVDILNNYSQKNQNIKVLNEYKKGASAARNKGLSNAEGEWIQFLDADDELLADKLEKQIEIANRSDADMIAGNCYLYKTVKGKTDIKTREIETANVWKGLITSKLGITSANLWRKKAVLSIKGWNEIKSSSQEYDLIFRLLKNNDKVEFCLLPLTIVHVRENSVHKSTDDNRFIQILTNNVTLRLDIKEYLQSQGKLTKDLAYIIDTYIYSYLVNTTGISPYSPQTGAVAQYVKKTVKESNLQLPAVYILTFHLNRIIKKIKNRL